jgi:acetoin utilization deacetylase AcuC-like enzyme
MTQHVPPRGAAVEEPARIVGIEAALKGHPVLPTVTEWRSNTSVALDIPVSDGSVWSSCDTIEVDESITDAAVETEYGARAVRSALFNTPVRGSRVDPGCGDIYWSAGTWEAAKTAAAAAIQATEDAMAASTTGKHAFCIVRPPGHHCFDVPAGFCILNNVVLAARKVLAAGKRVAILDWDYHFGDGTAAALWGEEQAMFVSLHAAQTRSGWPTYPARTARDFKGAGLMKATQGRCFNIQWPVDDADDAACAYAFRRLILPALQHFAPDVVLVSAGYDAIRGDDLAGMEMTPAAFGYMAAALACLGKPVIGVLEGGYNISLLAEGVVETVRGLQGSMPYVGADLEVWLNQEPQAEHRETVEEVRSYVLGADHTLEG